MRPPVARRKKARAGNTRVSLRTSTSPGRAGAPAAIREAAVLERAPAAADDEQSRGVARLERVLRDQVRRQLVVEVGEREPEVAPRCVGGVAARRLGHRASHQRAAFRCRRSVHASHLLAAQPQYF